MSVRAQLLSFAGRIGRKRFWLVFLCVIGTLLVTAYPSSLLARTGNAGSVVANVFMIVVLVLGAWISAANQVRRWHDLGRSGWMILICFIPILGFVINVICLGFIPGQRATNRFGPPPGSAGSAPPPVDSTVAPAEPPMMASPRPGPPSRRWRLAVLGLVAVFVVMPLLAGLFYFVVPAEKMAARRDWVRAVFGSAEASHRLGWRYRNGEGEPQDFAAAAQWFERAARKGLPQAQYDTGVLHFYGLGVPADSVRAAAWLEQAAAREYAPASTLLGVIAAESGAADRAMGYWQTAATQGDPWAESLLGSAYLARREETDENLVLALYWMEAARRDGAEPVGGQLQHMWATVPEERLESVTSEVFRRLEAGSPDAPVQTEEAGPPAAVTADTETVQTEEPPAETAPDDVASEVIDLAALVSNRLVELEDYVAVRSLFDDRSQADPDWAGSSDGIAVAGFLETMLADAGSVRVTRTDDGAEILVYTISGAGLTDDGVRGDRLRSDEEYRAFIVDALARNIAGARKPLRLMELLKEHQQPEGEASK